MENKIIRLCYRKIIDASSQKQWDKLVFEDSFTELLMQFQLYNQQGKYHTFADLINNVSAAEKLHFLVGTAITNYVKQLNEKVPDITNNNGKTFLSFKQFRFEIINSDVKNKSKHQVAVNFYTEPLVWHATVANQLIVAEYKQTENNIEEVLTEQFSLQPFLSIYSIKKM